MKTFNEFFSLRNFSTSNSDKKEKWDIKGYPIIILEINGCSKINIEGLEEILERTDVDNVLKKYGVILNNPVIFLPQVDKIPMSLYEDLLDVLKVICAIYFQCHLV